ncbi:MAG: insulinase family protein [Acidobacteria bacterium]|nr:insulinase family protein [Acidobacteriota bacterium]
MRIPMAPHALVALVLAAAASPVAAQEIAARPDALTFEPIVFEPPSPEGHRHVLKNGMVVFIAEDRALPLVNISLTLRVGGWLDPEGREGLASFTGSQMRRGGTKSLTAEELDERLDFLAAQASTGIGGTAGGANLNCLTDNLDEALPLFVEILREPRFQADRLALAKEQSLQAMKKRNDDSADIEAREWNVLLDGEGHFTNRFTTEASIEAITRDDLVAFHRRYVHPETMIAAVSGSFETPDMLRRLEEAFADWPGTPAELPPIPHTIDPAPPGLYRIEKDVNQGRVSMGLPGVMRDDPDVYALEVMVDILGGSGFTSRITTTVRSNEGLAYDARAAMSFGVWYPGRFRAMFQSKSPTVAWATELVLEEIRRIRDEGVTPEELATTQSSLIETFPSSFDSKARSMAIFASDEYTGRAPDYWRTYRDRIRSVTTDDVQRVARTHLPLEKMILLVVGNQEAIDRGDEKHAVTLEALAPGGRVTVLPLRDPMTMKMP